MVSLCRHGGATAEEAFCQGLQEITLHSRVPHQPMRLVGECLPM
jgi:hypothetical protein